MVAILTLAALLLGGVVTPHDVLNGGPSKATTATTTAVSPVVSPAVDDVIQGGPS
jgi:hypothetical protein